MILPTTYLAAMLLLVVSMLCWGSWMNTLKFSGNWRFELYYVDFAMGLALCSLIAAFTFGSGNSQELTFTDNLLLTGYRQMAWGVGAGIVFNLANILLVGAMAIAGIAVAMPITVGLALVESVIWNYLLNPQANPILLFGGTSLVLAAVLVNAFAYATHFRERKQAVAQPAKPRGPGPAQPPSPARGIWVSAVGGVLMGMYYPFVELGKSGENGISPYGIALLFAGGVLASTAFFGPLFMNFPLQGEPVAFRKYFTGTKKQHILGIAGGLVWAAGAISNFTAASAPPSVQVGPAVSYALGQGATLVSLLWGLLVWKEFSGAGSRVRMLLAGMICLFAVGLALVAIAPLYR